MEKKVQSFADVLNHINDDKFSMFKTLFSPNLNQKHKTKLSRHFSGDKDFITHPMPLASKSLMRIEEGNFKSLAE